jgi:hypothetical protein
MHSPNMNESCYLYLASYVFVLLKVIGPICLHSDSSLSPQGHVC